MFAGTKWAWQRLLPPLKPDYAAEKIVPRREQERRSSSRNCPSCVCSKGESRLCKTGWLHAAEVRAIECNQQCLAMPLAVNLSIFLKAVLPTQARGISLRGIEEVEGIQILPVPYTIPLGEDFTYNPDAYPTQP